jgi:hypothetical protein
MSDSLSQRFREGRSYGSFSLVRMIVNFAPPLATKGIVACTDFGRGNPRRLGACFFFTGSF